MIPIPRLFNKASSPGIRWQCLRYVRQWKPWNRQWGNSINRPHGQANKAYSFDGVDDLIEYSSRLQNPKFCAWFKISEGVGTNLAFQW